MKLTINLIALLLIAFSAIGSVTASEITVDRVKSQDANITKVIVQKGESDLYISGQLRRTLNRRGHIPGHLHIELYDKSGNRLATTTTSYMRKHHNSRISKFNESFSEMPNNVSRVKVIHHGLRDKHG
jgi:hypothetical protein